MKNYLRLFSIIAATLILSNCKKKDPEIPHESELITTVIYTLTPISGGADVIFKFTDLDGDAGSAPIIENGILAANTSYAGRLQLLNELETPAENITQEILDEQEAHQFFYFSSGTNVSVIYADEDLNKFPVGLSTVLTTTDAGMNDLTIILRHQPDKTAAGVSTGDITNAGGETDIEVNFNVDVQ